MVFGVRETWNLVLVLLLTRCVISDYPPTPTKLLYLLVVQCLADYVVLKIK